MKKLRYKILSHTADLRLEVCGKTIEELFENAATAIADILAGKKIKVGRLKIKEGIKEIIRVEAANLNALLVDFLNEVLAKSQINKAVYLVKEINIQEVESPDDSQFLGDSTSKKLKLKSELVGKKVKEFDEDIKAVTYHEVQIEERGKGKEKSWHTKLVLDI